MFTLTIAGLDSTTHDTPADLRRALETISHGLTEHDRRNIDALMELVPELADGETIRQHYAARALGVEIAMCDHFDQDAPEENFTRADQLPERIYVVPSMNDWNCFYTPDGEGRIWYETLELALEDVDAPVIFLDVMPDEN